jgi:hypothetical protein
MNMLNKDLLNQTANHSKDGISLSGIDPRRPGRPGRNRRAADPVSLPAPALNNTSPFQFIFASSFRFVGSPTCFIVAASPLRQFH